MAKPRNAPRTTNDDGSPLCPEAIERNTHTWKQEMARWLVSEAIREGKLVRPTKCPQCGDTPKRSKIHGHHADYDKPLKVEWLCGRCHSKEHRHMRERARAALIARYPEREREIMAMSGRILAYELAA